MSNVFGTPVHSDAVEQSSFALLLDQVLSEKPEAVLILCCDEGTDAEQRERFNALLPSIELPVFGGIFPSVIFAGRVITSGMVMLPVFVPVEIKTYQNLESAPLQQYDFTFSLAKCSSAMVLVDGLSRHIDYALNQIFQCFGPHLQVFGGGAGSLSFERKPCLFSNQGMLEDAMLVIAMQQPWDLAIGHGWKMLEGPFLANQVDDNRVIQLNFEPALDVYQKVVERHDGRLFAQHDFFALAKTYPFGLHRLDDNLLVRDPVTVEGNSLICIGKVPENTMLYILKGESNDLVSAAIHAVENKVQSGTKTEGLLFDCISRQLFLEDDFIQEVQGISATLGDTGLCGALVLGEIASGVSGAIHFHNKTAVTAVASNVKGDVCL